MNPLNISTAVPTHSAIAGRAPSAARLTALALLLCGAAFGAMAQYKIVSPDGHVTYTDKPPTPSDVRSNGNSGSSSGSGLPFETRQASAKYPVTLYTTKGCSPCDAARQWLRNRGVPFGEYSIDNDRSATLLEQRFGSNTLPVVTIGGQTVTGFSSRDLQSFIDAAGYPAQAHLVGYSWPAAVPLAPAAAPAPVGTPKATTAAPSTPPPQNQNGIQF